MRSVLILYNFAVGTVTFRLGYPAGRFLSSASSEEETGYEKDDDQDGPQQFLWSSGGFFPVCRAKLVFCSKLNFFLSTLLCKQV